MNSAENRRRGGAAVGFVGDLPAVEAGAVLYLRMWHDGPEAQAQVWNDFASTLGPHCGREALKSFERICSLCIAHGRRPLMRHRIRCKCLGADESCFANFIGYASEGNREDAMLIAATIVRPDVAATLAALAEEFGLALKRMTLRVGGFGQARTSDTIH
ncbi:MAG: hypothetical protein ACK5MY_15520 [Jhaorihella sp.]